MHFPSWLISHTADFKDSHLFENWVYFAELKVIFCFELQFKLPLILASEHNMALTLGELELEDSILVEALQDIGCQSVCMGAYGIKVPIDCFLDPAMLSQHLLWEANVFGIGCIPSSNTCSKAVQLVQVRDSSQ